MSGVIQNLRDWLRSPTARRRDDYRATFGTPQGKRVFEDLLKFGNAGNTSFTGDGIETAYHEGKRRMVLRIAKFINMEDEELIRLAQRSAEDGD